MKRPSFLNGACAAGVLALAASISLAAMLPLIAFSLLFKLMVPALGLAYILYLLAHSKARTGRLTALTAWTVFSVTAWLIGPPLALYILLHVGAIWLIRSLYFYSSIIPTLIDLGLNALGLATAFWAISHSGSTFLAVWCFFLVQALFVFIPPALTRRPDHGKGGIPDMENFERARRRAESAVRQLFAQ